MPSPSADILKKAAKIRRGKNRQKVFLEIDGKRMSSEISLAAFNSKSATYLSMASRALAEISRERLAEPLNPEEKTGRVYRLTSLGMKVKEVVVKYKR